MDVARIDCKEALDRIAHSSLIAKLEYLGIGDNLMP